MMQDLIRYDVLAQEALRSVVRRVLADAAREGLPGDHHFYITFRTDFPEVSISKRLAEKYPREMTIVLQHQFWDLNVYGTGFEVGLAFSGVSEMLQIPFDAVIGFFDPSVQFGLQFESRADEQTAAVGAAVRRPTTSGGRGGTSVSRIRGGETSPALGSDSAEEVSGPSSGNGTSDSESGGAEVVSLDAFRKK